MRFMRSLICLLIISLSLFSSCKFNNKIEVEKPPKEEIMVVNIPGPPAIVYKTNANYDANVAITLSEDNLNVVSYPAISDIKSLEKTLPIALENGYLLDQRGVDINSAFISITYEEYQKLENQPSATELLEMVIDKDPIIEYYNLGKKGKFKDLKNDINALILADKLKDYLK